MIGELPASCLEASCLLRGIRARLCASPSRAANCRLKALTDLPVCVGFGVSNAEQVKGLLEFADGVIVGSYLMDQLMTGAEPGAVLAGLRA